MKNEYLNGLQDGYGVIHKVKVKKNEKQPDYWGYFKINGKIYDVASWIHSNKENTSKYLSLVIKDHIEYKPDTEL
jgi:hypothetical protein